MQLIRVADSVGANLVEGDGRYNAADTLHIFIIARASARETRCWLRRATRRQLIPGETGAAKIAEIVAATQLLNRLINYRRNRKQSGRVTEEPAPFIMAADDPFTADLDT